MATGKVTIGGEIVKTKGVEAIKDLQENRTMIIQKLTQDPASKPEIVENLKTIDEVFDHYKPKAEVKFKDKEGGSVSEDLNFNNLADFSLNGLKSNSNFLGGLNLEAETYQQILTQLKGNNKLKKLLGDEGGKAALMKALLAVIKELEENV